MRRPALNEADVTNNVLELIDQGAVVETLGYLCIQGQGRRICAGCTSACNQSVLMVKVP